VVPSGECWEHYRPLWSVVVISHTLATVSSRRYYSVAGSGTLN